MRVNVVSPMALALAVSTLESGARGNTRTAIAKVLHLPASGSEPAHWWRQWLAWTAADRRGPHPALDLRTRLWVKRGFPVEPGFQTLLRESYAADWTQVDLAHRPFDESRRVVHWLEQGTGGKFPENSLAVTYAGGQVLVSTTFTFSARWRHPFDPAKTAPGRFFAEPEIQLPMMHGTFRGYYGKTESIQMARIPLAPGRNARWELFIFTPYDPSGSWQGGVNPMLRVGVAAMERKLKPATLVLTLPKFDVRAEMWDVDALRTTPMRVAFADCADLSGIAPGLKLGDLVWAGGVGMNEVGIGQSTLPVAPSAAPVESTQNPPTVDFKVDRVFFFAVRDAVSGVVVLMGMYGGRPLQRMYPI